MLYRVATIEECPGARTPVVIWELGQRDEQALDKYEGYPIHYRKGNFVVAFNGTRFAAMAYVMNNWKKRKAARMALEPEAKYLDLIRQGYAEAGFGSPPTGGKAVDRL